VTKSSIKNLTRPTGVNFLDTKYPNIKQDTKCIQVKDYNLINLYKYKVQPPIRVLYQNENFISYTDTKYLRVFISKRNLFLSTYLQSK
jgi:hypothetical protein